MTSRQPKAPSAAAEEAASFPNPASLTVPGRDQQALSVISSDMTDIPDEEGEDGEEVGAMGERVPGVTGPVGESGLPPSRPSTAATGKTAATSRKAPASSAGGRPPSAYSRTHVPSLTSSAFFRPMSSQRLQAQRGQRPISNLGPRSVPTSDGPGQQDRRQTESRHSATTAQSGNAGAQAGLRYDDLRPVSRGTDITELPDRHTANTSPNGANTLQSAGESVEPLTGIDLEQSPTRHRPGNLDLGKAYRNNAANTFPNQKSPRSFRSSFILSNRNSRNSLGMRQQGHEKLDSEPSTPHSVQQEDVKKDVKRELGKNYEYFTGNTTFFWGGRLQNTRERPINIGTGLAMLIPAVLFFAFSAHDLWHNVSPAIPILFAYVFLICFSSFLHASLTNPGILPRNLHPFPPPNPNEDPLTIGPALTEWTMVLSAESHSAAMEVPTKYCKTCNIWRPPRTHHCRSCDNCVETQDHHCVWLNNCVGRRNYRTFFAFVSSGTLLALFLFGASLGHILENQHRYGGSFIDAVKRTHGVPFAMVIYGGLVGMYPLSLTGYHLFLMARGETTREYLQSHKFPVKDRHRPFTQGNFFRNWVVVLCRPRPPTYLHFKSAFEEGDQRFGEIRGKRTAPLAREQQGGGLEMQRIGGGVVPPSIQGSHDRPA